MVTTGPVVDKLPQLQSWVEQAFGRYQAVEQRRDALAREVETLTKDVALLTLTETALSTLLSKVSEESLKTIEQTITYGLRVVFDDLQLTFRFRAGQVRGGQALEPVLSDGTTEQPILDAFGGGPATLVAFLLRLLVTHRLQLYPLLLLDETFAMVSDQYIPNLSRLLVELSTTMKMTFLLVTHQKAFVQNATRAYEVQDSTGGAVFAPVQG